MPPKLTARDAFNATVIGAAAGLLAWYIASTLSITATPVRAALPMLWLVLGIIAPLGLWIASLLAQRIPTIFQLAKYGLIGVLNTLLNLSIINFLATLTGITAGIGAGSFAIAGFVVANTHSFFWNKYWTFGARSTEEAPVQYMEFLMVTAASSLIGAALVAGLTHFVAPPFGLNARQWLNLANGFAIIVSLIWNFLGYKFFVFTPTPRSHGRKPREERSEYPKGL